MKPAQLPFRGSWKEVQDWPAYPDQYLYVQECRSGETWIVPIDDDTRLDLPALVAQWCKTEYAGELQIDGGFMPRLEGDYYAKIMTDNRAPDAAVCWTSGGFYLKPTTL